MPVVRLDDVRKKKVAARGAAGRRQAAWEEFSKNENLKKTYRIKPGELWALRQVALLGNVRSPRDFLFMLNIIRTTRRLKRRAAAK